MASVNASRGIANEEFDLISDRFLMGMKTNGRGVSVGVSCDHRNAQPLTPALKLLHRGSTESVGGGQDHRVISLFEPQS